MSEDIFSADHEVKPNFQKWANVGDSCQGVYVDRRVQDSTLTEGQQAIYTLMQEDGSLLMVGGRAGKPVKVIGSLETCKLGQFVGIRYEANIPSKKAGFNATKVIKVYACKMMPEKLAEYRGVDVAADKVKEMFNVL